MHLAVCGRKRRGIEPLPLPVWKVRFSLYLKRDGKRLAAAQDLERDNISREYISFGLFQLRNGADFSAVQSGYPVVNAEAGGIGVAVLLHLGHPERAVAGVHGKAQSGLPSL